MEIQVKGDRISEIKPKWYLELEREIAFLLFEDQLERYSKERLPITK